MLLDNYKLEKVKSKDNNDILVINGIYIHSKYSPLKEASSIKYDGKNIVLIFGFGLGYHVENIISNNPDCLFIIYEPLKNIYDSIHQYLKISNSKILILNDFDFSRIMFFFQFNKVYSNYRIQIYSNTGYKTLFPDLEIKFLDLVKNTYRILIQNIFTESNFYPLWTKNFIYNTRNILNYPILKISKKNLDINLAVICSAGPSLIDDLFVIKNNREKITIFSVDTALKTLLKYGITPDFIVSLDGQLYSIDDFVKNIPQESTLLLDAVSYPKILNSINLKNVYFTIADSVYENTIIEYFFKQFDLNLTKLKTGGMISDYCLSIAVNLGFKNIYFAGMDLSYPGFCTHSIDTPFYYRTLYSASYFNPQQTLICRIISTRDLIPLRSRIDKEIYSDFVMQNYSVYLKEFANKYNDINIYYGPFNGINIEGFKINRLENLINETGKKRFTSKEFITKNDIVTLNNDDIKKLYVSLNEGLFFYAKKIKNFIEIVNFNKIDNDILSRCAALYDEILNAYPFIEKFMIMTNLILASKNILRDNLIWYKHSFHKMLQSLYYLIRVIQKNLAKM
jgi:hypothetical protein